VESISFGKDINGTCEDGQASKADIHIAPKTSNLEGTVLQSRFLNHFGYTFNQLQADFEGQLIVFTKV
jgi:hypothetical protein